MQHWRPRTIEKLLVFNGEFCNKKEPKSHDVHNTLTLPFFNTRPIARHYSLRRTVLNYWSQTVALYIPVDIGGFFLVFSLFLSVIIESTDIPRVHGFIASAKGHFTHGTESPWPLHFKHSHWWKRRSRSKFTSCYAWRTNRVCECKVDVKSMWTPTWHQMEHASWSLGLFSKTTSWKQV